MFFLASHRPPLPPYFPVFLAPIPQPGTNEACASKTWPLHIEDMHTCIHTRPHWATFTAGRIICSPELDLEAGRPSFLGGWKSNLSARRIIEKRAHLTELHRKYLPCLPATAIIRGHLNATVARACFELHEARVYDIYAATTPGQPRSSEFLQVKVFPRFFFFFVFGTLRAAQGKLTYSTFRSRKRNDMDWFLYAGSLTTPTLQGCSTGMIRCRYTNVSMSARNSVRRIYELAFHINPEL